MQFSNAFRFALPILALAGAAHAQLADLRVTDLRLSTSRIVAGQTVNATFAIRNAGAVSARASRARITIEKPFTVGQFLIEFDVPRIDALRSYSNTVAVPIPANLIYAGATEVKILADATNVVRELFEGNNDRSVPTTGVLRPDLELSGLVAGQRWEPGSRRTFSVKVDNAGGAPSGVFELRLYLSRDPVITASDTPLGMVSVQSLQRGESKTASLTATIPANWPVGPCSIGFFADPRNRVVEAFENNNTISVVGTCGYDGSYQSFGTGCGGRAAPVCAGIGEPKVGSRAELLLSNGTPRTPGIIVIGGSRTQWMGQRLPLDLGPLGAPGCSLRVAPTVSIGGTLNAFGRMTVRLPLATGLSGKRFYAQGAVTGASNALSLWFSNGVETRIGD